MTGLAPFLWRAKQAAHEARVREWTGPHQSRSERGEKHPVYDFLFTYYSYRPSLLHRWHPGFEFTRKEARQKNFCAGPRIDRHLKVSLWIVPNCGPIDMSLFSISGTC